MGKHTFKGLILTFLFIPVLSANAEAPRKVAVLPFEAMKGIETETANALNEVFIGEARKSQEFVITSTKEVEELLGFEARKQMLGCTDSSCAVEIAGALGVDEIVFSSIAKFGDTYTISIKRLEASSATVVGQFSEGVTGDEKALLHAVRKAAATLFSTGSEIDEYGVVEKSHGERYWSVYLSGGIGAAGLATGIAGTIMYLGSKSELDEFKKKSSVKQADIDDNKKRGDMSALMINVGYSVAGAGIVTAIILGVVLRPHTDSVEVTPSENGVAVSFKW